MMNVRQPMLLIAAGVTLVTTKLNSHCCCVSTSLRLEMVEEESGERRNGITNLSCRSQTHTICSQSRREYLCHVHPWYRTPTSRITDNIQVDHNYHSNRRRAHGSSIRVWREGYKDGADDKHASGHPPSSANQWPFAAKALDTDDQKDSSRDDFDSAVDASREERGAGAGKTDRGEDLWCIVSNAERRWR